MTDDKPVTPSMVATAADCDAYVAAYRKAVNAAPLSPLRWAELYATLAQLRRDVDALTAPAAEPDGPWLDKQLRDPGFRNEFIMEVACDTSPVAVIDGSARLLTLTYRDDDAGVFVATCPALHVTSQGETREQADAALGSAIGLFVRALVSRTPAPPTPPPVAPAEDRARDPLDRMAKEMAAAIPRSTPEQLAESWREIQRRLGELCEPPEGWKVSESAERPGWWLWWFAAEGIDAKTAAFRQSGADPWGQDRKPSRAEAIAAAWTHATAHPKAPSAEPALTDEQIKAAIDRGNAERRAADPIGYPGCQPAAEPAAPPPALAGERERPVIDPSMCLCGHALPAHTRDTATGAGRSACWARPESGGICLCNSFSSVAKSSAYVLGWDAAEAMCARQIGDVIERSGDDIASAIADRDQALLDLDTARADIARMQEVVDGLRGEVERERQRLCAIGVLANSRSPAQLDGMLPEYDSASLQDVRKLLSDCLAIGSERDLLTGEVERMQEAVDLYRADVADRTAELAEARGERDRLRERERVLLDAVHAADAALRSSGIACVADALEALEPVRLWVDEPEAGGEAGDGE